MSEDELPNNGRGERGFFRFDKERHELVPVQTPRRLHVDAPFVQTDTLLEPLESMITGEMFDSKAKLMAHYKEHGCICTGGERPKPPKHIRTDPRDVRETVERAYEDLANGRVKLSERDKELCRREQRKERELKRRQNKRWA